MSSSNNNKKNDDGQGKKKEPTDTFDVKKPPALLTHCDEEVLTFTVKKHLNAERSRAKMQMENKLAPTSSEKDDHYSSRYAISANMSKSDILTLQDLQNSMDQSSYAVAASPATAGQYHSHPFAEVAKEEELEDDDGEMALEGTAVQLVDLVPWNGRSGDGPAGVPPRPQAAVLP